MLTIFLELIGFIPCRLPPRFMNQSYIIWECERNCPKRATNKGRASRPSNPYPRLVQTSDFFSSKRWIASQMDPNVFTSFLAEREPGGLPRSRGAMCQGGACQGVQESMLLKSSAPRAAHARLPPALLSHHEQGRTRGS